MSSMPKPWKHPDSGIYYHRIDVPKDIRETIGKGSIKNSLHTRDFSEAKRLFALQYAETQAMFVQARARVNLTVKDIEILSRRWFDTAVSRMEDEGSFKEYLIFYTGEEEADADRVADAGSQICEALEHGYEKQLDWVGKHVSEVLTANNILLLEGSEEHRLLTKRMCWRLRELSDIALARYYGDWTTSASDPAHLASHKLSVESRKTKPALQSGDYKPLSEIIVSFTSYKIQHGAWDAKTQADAEGVYAQLVEYLDGNTDPSAITREQLRDFSVLLSQLPTNYTRTPRFNNLSLHQLTEVAANEELKTIAAATVKKKFNFIKSLFKYAAQEEWVDRDRATGITIPKGFSKSRTLYQLAELDSIFTASTKAARKSDFWLPRIALTTGMRSNEILQLSKADIKQTSDIWYFDINEDMDIESGQAKKIKTDNSRRLVPVPDVLIKTGFIDYVEGISDGRLFACVHLGTDGSYSSVYSKRFNTLLERLGLKPDADELIMKDFHSFRHTFRANARAFGISKETADLLGGWKDQDDRTAGDSYGIHYESFMVELKTAIDKIDYSQLRFDRP